MEVFFIELGEIEWLQGLEKFKIERYGLKGVECLVNEIGRPDRNLKFIHIAGTNGKGSVSKFCSEVLIESGRKIGLFISPYIVSFNERIQVNGEFIKNSELVELINFIRPVVEKLALCNVFCSQFDVITAIALEYFKRCGCDFVVLEVGMGGRLDSTNVVLASSVAVVIVTKIGFDHVKELGPGLRDIAFEKAGIIKPGVVCVCCNSQPTEVLEVIEKTCRVRNAKLIKAYDAEKIVFGFDFNFFWFGGHKFKLKLSGPFQVENAMIALTALLSLNEVFRKNIIKIEHIQIGFERAFWPARFEIFKKCPVIILDGAHNVDGVRSLFKALKLCCLKPKVGVFSILKTKDYIAVLREVENMGFSKLILTQMDFKNVVKISELELAVRSLRLDVVLQENWHRALKLAKELAGNEGVIIVFGSLYFASQVRKQLND